MADIRRLAPHDPLPEGRSITVMRRLEEDDPRRIMIELIVAEASGAERTSRPTDEHGRLLDMDAAIATARSLADASGVALVHVVDRTQGARERDVLRHDGDRSVHGENLSDFDLEEGERGPDMRDLRPDRTGAD